MTNLLHQIQDTRTTHHQPLKLFRYLPLVVILFGIFVRLVQYLSNQSLWGDEGSIALNIIHRSYLELLQPLDYNQAAPPGFLWVEKLAFQLLGNHEYAFRLFPFIAGIISLVVFYKLSQQVLSAIAQPIAVTLFACLWYPIYYASEAKPYSSDAMLAVLLAMLLIGLRGKRLSNRGIVGLGVGGVVAMWFSYPAVFILGGVEIANLVTTSKAKWRVILANRWMAYYMWMVSFAAIYFFVIAGAMSNQTLQTAWGPEYPESIFDLAWVLESFKQFFSNPLGFHGISEEVAIGAFLIGCIALFKQDKTKLLLLTAPIFATLVATYLHKYPFRTRLVFFLTPFLMLIIAEGIAYLLAHFKSRKYLAVIGFAMMCIVLLPPTVEAGTLIFSPMVKRSMRPVVEYIKTHDSPGDVLLVNDGSSPDQFRYYAERYGYSESDYIFAYKGLLDSHQPLEQGWKDFQRQSAKLQPGQRVWFVITGLNRREKLLVKPRLDQIGQELDYFNRPGALTYLYRLK